jgi:hypothetical protein
LKIGGLKDGGEVVYGNSVPDNFLESKELYSLTQQSELVPEA